jgi:hypothetical protein
MTLETQESDNKHAVILLSSYVEVTTCPAHCARLRTA